MVTKVTAVIGASVDKDSGDLLVGLQGQTAIGLQLRRGMVKAFIATLTGLLGRVDKGDSQISF